MFPHRGLQVLHFFALRCPCERLTARSCADQDFHFRILLAVLECKFVHTQCQQTSLRVSRLLSRDFRRSRRARLTLP